MRIFHKLIVLLVVATICSCTEQKSIITLKKEMLTESDKLEQNILSLQQLVTNNQTQSDISNQYQNTKLQFKKVEWAMTCLLPDLLDSDESFAQSDEQSFYFAKKDFSDLDQLMTTNNHTSSKKLLLLQINNLLDTNRNTAAYLESIVMDDTQLANK